MNSSTRCVILAMIFTLICTAWSAFAADQAVELRHKWTGTVADTELAKEAPTVFTSDKALKELWKTWKLADKPPVVDFTKELVVLETTSGSLLNLNCQLSDAGNLKVLGMGTMDFHPGFRYVFATVSRDGVKTVNGNALPKE